MFFFFFFFFLSQSELAVVMSVVFLDLFRERELGFFTFSRVMKIFLMMKLCSDISKTNQLSSSHSRLGPSFYREERTILT